MVYQQASICALATAPGVGAIALIRVSGEGTFQLIEKVFRGKSPLKVASHTAHFGVFHHLGKDLDEVVLTVFKSPHSFTKEDSVEITCHGSPYIIQQILKALIDNGCKMAEPGEFTRRAYLNGRFDLVQAEAVADLINADSAAAHQVAFNQIRGGFSRKLEQLREQLIHFASLIELELDFGEEDVEFANREDLKALIISLFDELNPLLGSFDAGNVIKEGIPVSIIGPPNAGKSTLLNALLNEEKAIVTSIAGTTRDVIEDVMVLQGTKFRFIDTAGIRDTDDEVESIGIERSKAALQKSSVVIFLFENTAQRKELEEVFEEVAKVKTVLFVRNKCDLGDVALQQDEIGISAKNKQGLQLLEERILSIAQHKQGEDVVVSNARHYEQLLKTKTALEEVLNGLEIGITGDFLAQDIRLALHHLGEITGTITTDDLLANIFGKFCIGK